MDAEQYHIEGISGLLDRIDWNHLRDRFGIERETVTENPTVARQLAYGEYTDLVPGSTDDLVGLFSLKATPSDDGGFWKVTAYTMERPKGEGEDLYLLGTRIRSEAIRKALLERTGWDAPDGTRRFGPANANAGTLVTVETQGRRVPYLVSVHQPTNRVVGMPADQVRSYFMDGKGLSRGREMYGVRFSENQIRILCDSGTVFLKGCRTKDGRIFNCFVQFDASRQQPVICHPVWLRDVQKTGVDFGLTPQRP